MSRRRAVTVAVSGAVVAALAVFVAVLGGKASQRVATNTEVIASRNHVRVEPGARYCQRSEYIPEEAEVVALFSFAVSGIVGPITFAFGPAGRPLEHEVTIDERVLGPMFSRLPPHETVDLGRACVTNLDTEPVFFAGNLVPLNPEAVPGLPYPGKRRADEIRLDFFDWSDEPSWFAVAGDVADRWSLFRPWGMGPAWLWVLLSMSVLATGLALRTYLRQVPD